MDIIYFSQNFHWAILVIDHKCSLYKENQQNPIAGFGEIDQNYRFGAKMVYFDSFGAKMGQTDFFGGKAKMTLRTLIMLQLCARNQNKPMNGL